MINIETEELLPLAKAAEWLPRRRRGQKPHASTMYRWSTVGCKGIVLETLQVGGSRCTSRAAVQRFLERLTYGEDDNKNFSHGAQQTPGANGIGRELDEAGL